MQCLEVSGAVRLIYRSLGVKGLTLARKSMYIRRKVTARWHNHYRRGGAISFLHSKYVLGALVI